MRRALAIAGALALSATGAASIAWAAEPSPLWDDVAHPHRHACAQLVAEAGRFAQANQPHASAQALLKASALCPEDRDVTQLLGEALLQDREYAMARRVLEHARALAEDAPPDRALDASLAFQLGFAREVTGDLDGAIVEHRRLEAMGGLPAPNAYLVHYNLGDELMAVGRLQEAIDEYRRAVALATDRSMPRLALAVALDRHGEIDKSRAELAVALTMDPQLRRVFSDEYIFVPAADVHYYMALGLLGRGLTAEARTQLRLFLVQLPDGPYATQARERLALAEHTVDARELEVSDAGIDSRAIARTLGPIVGELERCLPAGAQPTMVKLAIVATGLRSDPAQPAGDCLDRALARAEPPRTHKNGWIILPLAGRRAAPTTK